MADDEVCYWPHRSLPSACARAREALITEPYHQQGASPREIVVEACRRDQPHLLEEVVTDMGDKAAEEIGEFFNGVTDTMGNYCLHICALYGSCAFNPYHSSSSSSSSLRGVSA